MLSDTSIFTLKQTSVAVLGQQRSAAWACNRRQVFEMQILVPIATSWKGPRTVGCAETSHDQSEDEEATPCGGASYYGVDVGVLRFG